MKVPYLGLGLLGLATNMLTAASDDIAIPKYTTYAEVQDSKEFKAIVKPGDDIAAATELARHVVPGAQFRLMDDHHASSDGVTHVYFRQTWKNADIEHRIFNVNVKNGAIFSFGENFERSLVDPANTSNGSAKSVTKRTADGAVSALNAVIKANGLDATMADVKTEALGDNGAITIKGVNGTFGDPQAELVYTVEAGKLVSTWKIQVSTQNSTLVSYVSTERPGEVLDTINVVSNFVASFEVYPWNIPNPDKGSRQVVEDPWDTNASPFTWVGDRDGSYYDTTRGNNAIAGTDVYPNWEAESTSREPSYFPAAGPGRTFKYPFSTSQEKAADHRDASITQVFYTVNKYHDLLYMLGFDEKAGNFQQNNNKRGGKEGDPVLVLVQDTEKPAFYAPEDGKRAVMFLPKDYNFPRGEDDRARDPAMDATVLIHEYTHGLTSRLTGGPASSMCVDTLREADFDVPGLNEGWSDFAFLATHLTPSDNRTTQFLFAPWAKAGKLPGRLHPYSTDMGVNGLTYGATSRMLSQMYHIGNFWATTLNEVLWNLVDKHGITAKDTPEMDSRGVPTDGRYYTLKLIMHAMMLQPCFPTMVSARDAILDADVALGGGENQCEIWKAFAKRGLGRSATYEKKTFDSPSQRKEDFSVPDTCK